MDAQPPAKGPTGIQVVVLPAAAALVTEPASRAWRHRLGPLAWVALEHLALSSHLTDQGWVAPVGVRDLATGIGVTKDTAARAVATLRAAGMAVLTRVESQDGRKRSGYQLHLPEPLQLFTCPACEDSPRTRLASCREREYESPAGCPESSDGDRAPVETDCIPHQDSDPRREVRRRAISVSGNGPQRVGLRPPDQLPLFDAPIPSRDPSTGEKA